MDHGRLCGNKNFFKLAIHKVALKSFEFIRKLDITAAWIRSYNLLITVPFYKAGITFYFNLKGRNLSLLAAYKRIVRSDKV